MLNLLNWLDSPPDLQVGDLAPDFSLKDSQGQTIQLYELLKQGWVVLFFYPKDNTPGCTAQACSFRDSYTELRQLGAELIGISGDSEGSHQGFQKAQRLSYPLLSDPKGQVANAYGIHKTLGLLPGRVTFVIAPNRTIRLAYSSQLNPQSHAQKALEVLKSQVKAP